MKKLVIPFLLLLVACGPKNDTESTPYYANCSQAPGPLASSSPGYRPELDRNNDGVACEAGQ